MVSRLEIQGVSTAYHGNLVLEHINLDVAPGEVLGLIGPNGAGKTTLIRAASGVLPLQAGTILLEGTPIQQLSIPQRARLLAVVPQARHLPPAFTVRQTVLLGRTPHRGWLGIPSQADETHLESALAYTRTGHLAQRKVGELSGGEQQRVLLARALAQDTPLLLLDEPTAHLDLKHQVEFLELVSRLAQEQNLAVLLAIHDLNLVAKFASRVALLVEGKLQAIGAPSEVLTGELLSAAYQTPLRVVTDPDKDQALVLPG